jgi:hypothetical protein
MDTKLAKKDFCLFLRKPWRLWLPALWQAGVFARVTVFPILLLEVREYLSIHPAEVASTSSS